MVPQRRQNDEEIIDKPRDADALLPQGKPITETFIRLGVTDQTYYRRRKKYGGVKVNQFADLLE